MFRLIGAVTVVVSGFLFAHYINRRKEEKFERLISFIMLVRYIRKQIECYCLPVNEILMRCDEMLIASCGAESLDMDKIRPERAFLDFLESCGGTSYEKADVALKQFSSELGRGYRDEQLRVCDLCLCELEEVRHAAEEELKKQKKLNYTLSVSGAVMAVLLMI